MDCFASATNNQLPRYNSNWLNLGTKSIDSLRLSNTSLGSEHNSCDPPW